MQWRGRILAMARTLASLPVGSRITDYISLGVVSRAVPREKIDAILTATGKTSIRQRELPAHLVVYYVIALALYMQSSYREVLRCLLEGIQWLTKPNETIQATGKSGISQARSRLGAEPLRRLYEQVVVPIASENTRGRGIESGDCSVWTAARWMSPTPKRTKTSSGVPPPVEDWPSTIRCCAFVRAVGEPHPGRPLRRPDGDATQPAGAPSLTEVLPPALKPGSL